MLLARDLIVGIIIPSSIPLPVNLFAHSVIHDLLTKLISHMKLLMMLYYREGLEISLHHTERQIPVSIRVNPTATFGDTCNAPL